MVRRYEEPIEVRAGAGLVGEAAGEGVMDPASDPTPSAFLWRGRLYVVRAVIGHWRERRAWWREALDSDEAACEQLTNCLEQDVWRVEASPGRLAGIGVYDIGMHDIGMRDAGMRDAGMRDLGLNGSTRGWRLLRVAD